MRRRPNRTVRERGSQRDTLRKRGTKRKYILVQAETVLDLHARRERPNISHFGNHIAFRDKTKIDIFNRHGAGVDKIDREFRVAA